MTSGEQFIDGFHKAFIGEWAVKQGLKPYMECTADHVSFPDNFPPLLEEAKGLVLVSKKLRLVLGVLRGKGLIEEGGQPVVETVRFGGLYGEPASCYDINGILSLTTPRSLPGFFSGEIYCHLPEGIVEIGGLDRYEHLGTGSCLDLVEGIILNERRRPCQVLCNSRLVVS